MKTSITRRVTFSAGHRLYNSAFDDAKNRRIFGDCANPNGHGHNYILEVTVTGEIDPETGMVINLKDMKRIITEQVIAKVDHKNLNLDVDFMQGVIPTTENVAHQIWEILDRAFGEGLLENIVLHESENNRVKITR
ncbi:MAG: 6-carboxytetrahydropterin synthase [candidate division Zixibacteria bacterium]|nr:6-carboxytetrahydropterin synthase [candidate division Zixibacteria bacterium]